MDDAICATRAALEEGILPGGGYAYAMANLELLFAPKGFESKSDIMSLLLVRESIVKPIKLIAENSGKDSLKVVNMVANNKIGYNAKTDTFEDMKLAGVIDPTKVTRMALENAASIAGMVLLTSCCIDNCN
jgi:chaperonin GroEL